MRPAPKIVTNLEQGIQRTGNHYTTIYSKMTYSQLAKNQTTREASSIASRKELITSNLL